jgi:hypothetical protein
MINSRKLLHELLCVLHRCTRFEVKIHQAMV